MGLIIGLIIAVVVVILVIVFIATYNGLVGYMQHERGTMEAVTNARNQAQSLSANASIADRAKAEGELSGVLARLMAVVENYPDLKANQNFLALQEELTSTENKISFSRQYYNDSVLQYNNKTQMFPSNVIAGMTGFKSGEFFEVTVAEEKVAPKVSFTQPQTK
jgi:LemA protein